MCAPIYAQLKPVADIWYMESFSARPPPGMELVEVETEGG